MRQPATARLAVEARKVTGAGRSGPVRQGQGLFVADQSEAWGSQRSRFNGAVKANLSIVHSISRLEVVQGLATGDQRPIPNKLVVPSRNETNLKPGRPG